MKNIILLLAVLLCSCKKDMVCTCQIEKTTVFSSSITTHNPDGSITYYQNSSGAPQTVKWSYEETNKFKSTKRHAKDACSDRTQVVNADGGENTIVYKCKLN